jgi:hypothetical protein
MNRINLAISEILSQYPELREREDEVVESIVESIGANLVRFIAEVDLPNPSSLMLERRRERKKPKGFRMSDEEFREKLEFINVLRKLKLGATGYETDATSLFEPNGKVSRGETPLPKLSTESFSGLRIEELEREINPSDIGRRREAVNNRTDVWEESFEKINSDRFAPYRGHIDELVDTIFDVANTISGNKVEKVTYGYDAEFGNIIRIGLAQNAREAFESWLKLLDKIDTKDLGINIRVDWTGEDNLSDDEFVDYMVEIMLKSGVGPKVSEDFDSVKAVREGWV